MRKIHTIRLTNAWETPRASCWRRRFGRPTGLGPDDRVWLVLDSTADRTEDRVVGAITVNGVAIPMQCGGGAWRTDISGLLQPRNELVITVEAGRSIPHEGLRTGHPQLPPGIRGVWLEIGAAD